MDRACERNGVLRVQSGRGRNPEASKSVGSNGETVLRLKAEQAFGVGVWTFETSMPATLTPRILILPVSDATGLSRPTIRSGRRELKSGSVERGRIRRPGAGRPSIEQSQPGIKQALEKLVDPLTRGDPESPLRWTCKSRAKLTAALSKAGWKVSSTTVGRLLHELGYSLQSVRKSLEGTTHPDRDAQFEHINTKADDFLQRCQPVVSVDTKKKELVGEFKNVGREWQPKGSPEKSLVHLRRISPRPARWVDVGRFRCVKLLPQRGCSP